MNQQSLWQPSDIMSAETGTEPDAPKKRGRIPQSAWPGILERYRAGQTLSAIAREFDCTPSAISYIVRKAEAVGSDMTVAEVKEETGSVPTEASRPVPPAEAKPPQPEAAPSEPPAASSVAVEPRTPETRVRLTRPAEPSRERIGPAKPAMPSAAPPAAERASAGVTAPPAPPPPAVATPTVAAAPVAAAAPPPVVQPGSGRAEPIPPVDAVEQRLRETARSCLNAYRGWRQVPGENSIQSLHDAVHELRKALARIEIDMSASRRDEQVARPIPIPAHRAARRSK